MKNEPLYLPKGSIRAILIIALTTFICTSIFFRIPIPEQVIVIWAGAIGWYFGMKVNEQKQKNGDM